MRIYATARGFSRRGAALALLCAVASVTVASVLIAPGVATAAAGAKIVSYRGVHLRVPAAWPVFHLNRDPAACVRFNRHAVYLGSPGAVESCPAAAIGRTEAILVSPGSTSALPGAAGLGSAVVRRARGVTITATWRTDPGLVRTALGSLWPAHGVVARADRALVSAASGGAGIGATGLTGTIGVTGTGGGGITGLPGSTGATGSVGTTGPIVTGPQTIFTGLGFDACTDPSATQLNAWLASPYRAVGIYIGGADMGCSQPNLNVAYVSAEIAAGWHLIPTYVGLQSPDNSCSCTPITPSQAAAQGLAAAEDAVVDAQAVGIGKGNPIYDDMEAYPPGKSTTPTVLTFLSAWTTELHALGYSSGVYSSADSGIQDMVAALGGPYVLPDDIWIADWDGEQSTVNSKVPSTDWSNHQRLHQYEGAHDEKYGGTSMNIDSDYVDAATVGSTSTIASAPSTPTLTISPQANGAIELNGTWSGQSDVSGWRLLGGAGPTTLGALSGTLSSGQIVTHSAFPFFAAQALGTGSQVLGTTPLTATPAHLAIYGKSIFVPTTGWSGLPVGCFTGATCRLTLTISAGKTVLARTKPERVGNGVSGLIYFSLSAAGHRTLAKASGDRLPVTVTISDGSGVSAVAPMNLDGFATSGRGPARTAAQGSKLKVVGLEDFVAGGGFGGVLADCVGSAPCHAQLTVSSGRTTLARTGSEFMGANELSYLSFRLSAQGRSLLASATGGMLGIHLRLSETGDAANAEIALIRFG